ncbi:hypothetical protein [Thalassotalea sp. G2M2-11]|uniref:hypothetical protein n=1 Tax=Thalassotalea sp. G2M2-11 TaxID=2787627 RepID=UPI0019D22166|nr:hypothetical protein [Thalassotalea sp. G2M2-11]
MAKAGIIISLFSLPMFVNAGSLSELLLCAQIKENQARLSCYDKLVASVNTEQSSQQSTLEVRPTAPVKDNGEAVPYRPVNNKVRIVKQPVSEQANVVDTPKITNTQDDIIGEQVFTIAQAQKNAADDWQLTFTNGQVWWLQGESDAMFKSGQQVELNKGFLGVVYLKKADDNKRIPVKRIK